MIPATGNLQDVVAGGFCVGCGACTAVKESKITIVMDEAGRYQAEVARVHAFAPVLQTASSVCPFGGGAASEDALSRAIFGGAANQDPMLGHYEACYAGYVNEGEFRRFGSSGGVARWILSELLQKGEVDEVVQVVPAEADDLRLFRYAVSRSSGEVLRGSRSAYYPVEMSAVLKHIRENPRRYAITGVPCFIKALRLLAQREPVYRERIRYCVGIICGHLKSARYADMIGWQLGIEPGDLGGIDFRYKVPGANAKQKAVAVKSRRPGADAAPPTFAKALFGTDYELGFFQYRACDYCDDVVAELADISVGDAWLPQYIPDGGGTSLIIVRNPEMHRMLAKAVDAGRLRLDPVSRDQAVTSQEGGFRHRREGLAYRLHLDDMAGRWRPPKRVSPSAVGVPLRRRRIYEARIAMAEASHDAFAKAGAANSLAVFVNDMTPLVKSYRALYQPSFWQRVRNGMRRRAKRFARVLVRR